MPQCKFNIVAYWKIFNISLIRNLRTIWQQTWL